MLPFGNVRLAPRRLLALLVLLTVVPLVVLLWLGWRVIDQDRLLEESQLQDRVERAADSIAAALQRAIVSTERDLAESRRQWPEGVVAVTLRGGTLDASPAGRLAYVPVAASLRQALARTFLPVDALEHRQLDYPAAVEALRGLLGSADAAVRAGALLRLGRNLQRLDRTDEALEAYAELGRLDDVGVEGVPAPVAARYARCRLLEKHGRTTELAHEAQNLLNDLRSARWPLSAPAYALYAGDAWRWSAEGRVEQTKDVLHPHEQLADGVQQLWERWQSMNTAVRVTSRRELLMVSGEPVVALWEVADEAMQAVVATPPFVKAQWLSTVVPLLEEQRVRLELRGLDGRAVQAFGTDGTVGAATDAPVATRAAEDTALPWRLAVTGLDAPGQGAGFILRRRLLISGFALLMTMALVAGVVIVRAVARELAFVRLQSDFVAAVSHEFRTPLTTLRQFTDLLRDNRSMDDQRRQVCYDAQSRATDRLTRLVESLLDFGRMEAGAHRYAFGPSDVTSLVRRVVDDFRDQAPTTSRDVIILATESVEASVDEGSLSRALSNLLDNAKKYSPEGSRVEVMVTGDGDTVRIAVRDYGLGIPAGERRLVFAKFHRGEEARQRRIKGTGLGLAMVNEIVSAHHGTIELDSAPGLGSTFTIVLPVAQRHIDVAADPRHAPDINGHQAAMAHRTAASEP